MVLRGNEFPDVKSCEVENLNEKADIKLKVLIRVGLVVLFHIIIFYYSNIRVEESIEIQKILVSYFSPIILLCTTCVMSLKGRACKYNLIWTICSTFPSIGILRYFKNLTENNENVAGMIDITYLNLDNNRILVLFYFPLVFSIIQIILMLAIWIMKLIKEK